MSSYLELRPSVGHSAASAGVDRTSKASKAGLLFASRAALGILVTLFVLLGPASIDGAIVLNEFNAVGSSKVLKDDKTDVRLGIIEGNGGNWIELVVVEDHADIRGWELWWAEESNDEFDPIWDEDRFDYEQGIIRFADAPLWGDLRAGTLITIAEMETITAEDDTVVVDGSDTSFSPDSDDWWIHVWSFDEALIVTETNVPEDSPGNFSVGNDNWEIRLVIPGDEPEVVWGPIGEDIDDFSGAIQSDEVGKLEREPGTDVTIEDYQDGGSSSFGAANIWSSGEEQQTFAALRTAGDAGGGNGGGAGFAIAIQADAAGGGFVLSWTAPSAGTYTVQRADSLPTDSWSSIGNVEAAAVEATVSFTDPTTAMSGYYRVVAP